MRKKIFPFIVAWSLSLIFWSCSEASRSLSAVDTPQENVEKPGASPYICSKLSFPNVTWPEGLLPYEIEAFQLALNITGSFEGHDGWQNLATDFDGQGMSLGLLNQPLGVGNLQPLFIKLKNRHPQFFESLFTKPHYKSITGMLNAWQLAQVSNIQALPDFMSPLDKDYPEWESQSSANYESVLWARKTLYKSKNVFHKTWKKELLALAGSPEYINIQIESAWDIHEKALRLHHSMGVNELRTYLLMFDIVVQNGNLKPQDHIDYAEWLQENPWVTSTEKLEKIVELRLRHVKPQWVKVVRERKMSLIHGGGRVQGRDRDYEKEHCFNRMIPFGDTNELK